METIDHPAIYPIAVVAIVLSALAIVLDIPPLVWHFRNRNIAAWSLIFWILILNVTVFCNAIIWPNDDFASWWDGQGLCDVEAKLFVGATVAIPGALACIMRGLAKVLDTNNTVVTTTKGDRRKRLIIEIIFCFGCPVYFMAIHYVVQHIRYYLWGISGCNTPFDNSWVTIGLIFIWPPILTLVDTYYAGLVIIRLYRYRRDLSGILQASNTTNSRFMRLFFMSLILILCILPVQFYVLAVNVAVPHTTFSWAEVHGPNWNQAVYLQSDGQIIFDRWIRIGCGFLVFFFFGVGSDAIKMYRSWLLALGFARVFPSLHPSARSQSSSRGTLNSLSTRLKQAFGRRRSECSPASTLVAHQSIVESQDKTEMRSTSTSSGNGTLQFLLTKVKTLWPGRFRNNTSNRSAGIRKSVNTNSAYSTFNDQQTSDEPYPLTSVISVTEASAFADAWAGELSPGTKADLRRADVLVKRELGRSSETLESAGEAIPVSDHYRGSNTRDFAV